MKIEKKNVFILKEERGDYQIFLNQYKSCGHMLKERRVLQMGEEGKKGRRGSNAFYERGNN